MSLPEWWLKLNPTYIFLLGSPLIWSPIVLVLWRDHTASLPDSGSEPHLVQTHCTRK